MDLAPQRRANGHLAALWRMLTAWCRPKRAEPEAAAPPLASISTATPPFAPEALILRYAGETSDHTDVSLKGEALWERGAELLKGFLVEDDELGRGGMGRVLLVRRLSSHQLYAVKRAHPFSDNRAAFLAELWTWIDLPSHPHIVACHFFRTIEEDIAIFGEFVPGASLLTRIEDNGLPDEAVTRLDIAIQVAWALEALHALGLVHQDVKPANVLVRLDGHVKLADFGLAAARARLSEASDGLTANHGTPAYRSPEQAAGEKVTRSSDIWSFGVSLLEMFTGRVQVVPGEFANEYLEEVIAGKHPTRCPLSAGLIHVLRVCMKTDPSERWSTMGEVANRLRRVYTAHTGYAHPRVKPSVPPAPSRRHDGTERWTSWGFQWDDPMPHLKAAIKAEGYGDARQIAEGLAAASAASLTGRALVDIALFEEARSRYLTLIEQGHTELRQKLWRVCAEKASVHAYLGDAPGAMRLFGEALDQLKLVKPQTNDIVREIASTHINRGIVLLHLEDPEAGLRAQAGAAQILKSLVEAGDVEESGELLAKTYYNMGGALSHLDRVGEAGEMWVHTAQFREWLLTQGLPVTQELAETYMAMAHYIPEVYPEGAIDRCRRVSALLAQSSDPKAQTMLAQADVIRGHAMSCLGAYKEGALIADRAINDLTRLVQRRPDARATLAEMAAHRAMMAERASARGAIPYWDRAIALYRQVVFNDGKYEFQSELEDFIERRKRLSSK